MNGLMGRAMRRSLSIRRSESGKRHKRDGEGAFHEYIHCPFSGFAFQRGSGARGCPSFIDSILLPINEKSGIRCKLRTFRPTDGPHHPRALAAQNGARAGGSGASVTRPCARTTCLVRQKLAGLFHAKEDFSFSIARTKGVRSIAFLRRNNELFNNPLSVQVRLALGGEAATGPLAGLPVLVYRPLVAARATGEGRYDDRER
jgi:hypothetical protein